MATAKAEAEKTVTTANSNAHQTLTSAKSESARLLASARKEADSILSSARAEAASTRASSRAQAQEHVERVEQSVLRLLDRANAVEGDLGKLVADASGSISKLAETVRSGADKLAVPSSTCPARSAPPWPPRSRLPRRPTPLRRSPPLRRA